MPEQPLCFKSNSTMNEIMKKFNSTNILFKNKLLPKRKFQVWTKLVVGKKLFVVTDEQIFLSDKENQSQFSV